MWFDKVRSLKMTANQYRGHLAEMAGAAFLEKKGFRVCSFKDALLGALYDRDKGRKNSLFEAVGGTFWERRRHMARKMLGRQTGDFLQYASPVLSAARKRSGDYVARETGLASVLAGAGLDFVARKAAQHYVVEVKANRAVLRKRTRWGSQVELLSRARRFGFVPLIIHVDVSIEIPEEKITVEEV